MAGRRIHLKVDRCGDLRVRGVEQLQHRTSACYKARGLFPGRRFPGRRRTSMQRTAFPDPPALETRLQFTVRSVLVGTTLVAVGSAFVAPWFRQWTADQRTAF